MATLPPPLDFSDAAWAVPRVTLSPSEERALITTLGKMANGSTPLHGTDIAMCLLETERLLTPRAAKAVFNAIEKSVFLDSGGNHDIDTVIIIASFLTKPKLWQSFDFFERNEVWSDQKDACKWARTWLPSRAPCKPLYAEALAERARDLAKLRATAGPILAKTLPASVLARAGPQFQKVSSCGSGLFIICRPKLALTGVGQPGGRAGV
jgi:hypothetical protein